MNTAIASMSITVGSLAVMWLIYQAWENGVMRTLVTAFCGTLVGIISTIGLALAGVLTSLASALQSVGRG
jgi:hypothetical protein